MTQNISYTIGNNNDTGLFEKVDGKFVVQEKPSDAYANEKKMLLDGFYAGKMVSGGKADAFVDANFLIGDTIFGYHKEGDDHRYFSAIKTADNKWFYGTSFTGTAKSDWATFEGLMKTVTETADIYYALRPLNAVEH